MEATWIGLNIVVCMLQLGGASGAVTLGARRRMCGSGARLQRSSAQKAHLCAAPGVASGTCRLNNVVSVLVRKSIRTAS